MDEEMRKEAITTLKEIDKDIKNLNEKIKTETKKLEKLRNSKIILFFISERREIDRSLVTKIYNQYKYLIEKPVNDLDVIVHSGGGDIDATYHLIRLFRKMTKNNLTFIVPRWAKSAATCLICGGDKIVMDEPSEIGPVDPQIHIIQKESEERFSPLSITITLELLGDMLKKGYNEIVELLVKNINPLSLGEHLRSLTVSPTYLKNILESRMFKGKKNIVEIEKIANILGKGYPHHGYCILIDDAKEMGLNICKLKSQEWIIVWNIWNMYDDIRRKKFMKDIMIKEFDLKIKGIKEFNL